MVLFPDPLAPTKAVVFFAGIKRSRPVKTGTFGRVGYEKWTPFNSMAPIIPSGLRPSSDSESISGWRSMTWKRSWAAAAALVTWRICGAICVRAWAATMMAKTTLGG